MAFNTNTKTFSSLKKNYQDYLQAQNSKINPYGTNSFWDIDAGAMALILLDLHMNLSLIKSTIYPQNAVGTAVDQLLYSRGLPARGGLTYGTVQVTVTATTATTIPANTVFTDTPTENPTSFTNNQYQNLIEETGITVGSTLTLYALNPGSNYIEPLNNYLQATIGTATVTVQVNVSTNGQDLESDQSCINRVLLSVREPRAGARESDYKAYALQSDSNITDCITLINYIVINNISILGVFVLIGTFITEYQLNQGLLPTTTFTAYSREADSTVIDNANNYIQGLKLVALPVYVNTSLTKNVFTDSEPLNITVGLVTGFSLSTLVTVSSQDQNMNPITIQLSVEDLIKKSLRSAICNQPFGGTQIGPNLYVTMDSLLYVLNSQLSSANGSVAQVLTNAVISNADQTGGIQTDTNISYIFDIESYNSIVVTQQVSI